MPFGSLIWNIRKTFLAKTGTRELAKNINEENESDKGKNQIQDWSVFFETKQV